MTPEAEFPTLCTPRLRLREISDADVPALCELHGPSDHMQWFGSDPITGPEGARQLVQTFSAWRRLPNPGTRWGIERTSAPGLIGSCGLFAWNRNWRKCSLGYELAAPCCGQGLMREALTAIIGWGLVQMQLHRIEAQVHERNEASLGLLHRLGFVQEGRLRELGYWGGRHHDLLQLSLLASEWQTGQAAAPKV